MAAKAAEESAETAADNGDVDALGEISGGLHWWPGYGFERSFFSKIDSGEFGMKGFYLPAPSKLLNTGRIRARG